MKRRVGIMIAMLAAAVLLGLPVVHAQRRAQTATQPVEPCAPVPSIPSVPNVPNIPSIPNIPSVDPLGDVMFPPDLIVRHARELGLTDEQKVFMRGEIQSTTTRFNELQWQLQEAMEAFHQSLESNSVNDQQALSQLDKVLGLEREIKRLHIGMGIRIKNQLTPEQQAKLRSLRMARA
jgi:Spy/CpxP family protein refolding chaperone